ncbi:MAG TPA: hypothetical protein VEX68_12125 [Bryobacteraceae bacterium]|nr:hypothetical protein [Bryobacteraceae bacterium]
MPGSFDGCHVAANAVEVALRTAELDNGIRAPGAHIHVLGLDVAGSLKSEEVLSDFFDEHELGAIGGPVRVDEILAKRLVLRRIFGVEE